MLSHLQVRVWDISGLRKKTVSPGGDDVLRIPQVALFFAVFHDKHLPGSITTEQDSIAQANMKTGALAKLAEWSGKDCLIMSIISRSICCKGSWRAMVHVLSRDSLQQQILSTAVISDQADDERP